MWIKEKIKNDINSIEQSFLSINEIEKLKLINKDIDDGKMDKLISQIQIDLFFSIFIANLGLLIYPILGSININLIGIAAIELTPFIGVPGIIRFIYFLIRRSIPNIINHPNNLKTNILLLSLCSLSFGYIFSPLITTYTSKTGKDIYAFYHKKYKMPKGSIVIYKYIFFLKLPFIKDSIELMEIDDKNFAKNYKDICKFVNAKRLGIEILKNYNYPRGLIISRKKDIKGILLINTDNKVTTDIVDTRDIRLSLLINKVFNDYTKLKLR